MLNVIGLMCLPPINEDPKKYFIKLNEIAKKHNLPSLSMGMLVIMKQQSNMVQPI